MANRFPLIVDSVQEQIKELPSGDNLNLTGSGISAVRNILPETSETYDLGSASLKWKDLYLSGNSIFIGDGSISLANGVFTFTDENDQVITLSVDGTQFTDITANTITADEFIGDGSQVTSVNAIALEGSDKAYFENYAETFANSAYANAVLYVDNQITDLVNSAPGVLDTLNELAEAIGDDDNFFITVNNNINTAYSNAVSYTDTVANTTYANSISYTDGEISTLYSNVTAYADSGDATTYSNATAYADSVADDAYTNAVSEATSLAGDAYTNAVAYVDTQTTDTIEEGNTNLYYTDSRARDSLSAAGDLTYDSNTGQFSVTTYKSTDFDTDFSGKTTDELTEGNTNLYYLDSRVDSHLSGANGITYSSGAITADQDISSGANVTFTKVTGLATPNANTDATNKEYVDDLADTTYANAISYTDGEIAALVNSAPGVLDTLNELAAAINDDENFAATITNQISNAYSNAVSDATDLASNAYSNAVSYTDGEISTLYTNVTSYADGVAVDAYSNAIAQIGDGTIEVANGVGLSGNGSFNVNDFTNTTITIQHADTSSVANVDNSGSTVLQDITFDEFGHVQSVSSANLTASDIPYSNSGTELSAGLLQTAIDELYDTKLDTSALTSSITFFPTTANGDVAGYAKLVTSSSDSDFDSTAVNVSTGTFSGSDNLVGSLVSDAGVLEGSTTPINITTVGNVRRTSGNDNDAAEFYFEVYKRDSGGTETLIGTSNATRSVNVATYEEFIATALISDTLFTETDRVVLKFYASVVAGPGGRTYEFQYGGGQPVRSLFPVPVTVVPQINDAEDIIVDASGFSGILSGADDDVQAALATIDSSTTDNIDEGNTNLYYLDSRVDSHLSGANGISYSLGAITADQDISSGANVTFTEVTGLTAPTANTDATNKQYVDDLADTTYANGTSYTDGEISALYSNVTAYADSGDATTYSNATAYADDAANAAYSNAISYTDTEIASLVNTAPVLLDTLNELAAAINDDPDFANSVTNQITTAYSNAVSEATVLANNAFTNAVAYVDAQTTDTIEEGNTNLYWIEAPNDGEQYVRQSESWVVVDIPTSYDSNNFVSDFALQTTDDLTEGNTSLYFTDSRVIDTIETNTVNSVSIGITKQQTNTAILDYQSNTIFTEDLETGTVDEDLESSSGEEDLNAYNSVVLSSWSLLEFHSSKLIVTAFADGTRQMSEYLLVHNGVATFLSECGTMSTGNVIDLQAENNLFSINTYIDGNNMIIEGVADPQVTTDITFSIHETLFRIQETTANTQGDLQVLDGNIDLQSSFGSEDLNT